MYSFPPGSTGVSIQFFLRSSASGDAITGLAASSAGAAASYTRAGGSASPFALVALASPTAAWVSGGFIEIDPVNQKGMYRLDLPNGALAAGAAFVSAALYFNGVLGEAVIVMLTAAAAVVGPGGFNYTATVQNSVGATPVAGASAWVSTDQAGANVIAGALTTNAQGQATFQLQAGTYYLWVAAQGFTAVNPATIAVAGAGGFTVVVTPATPALITPATLQHVPRLTAKDVGDQLLDFMGADPGENAFRISRRALLQGLKEFGTASRWSYLYAQGRLFMNGAYSTGTVQYQYSSGTYPRQLTLTGGTWPAWANFGYIRLNNIVAKVNQAISPTVLTLLDPLDYAADQVAGQGYTLFRDTYTLPADFLMGENFLAETIWGTLEYVPPSQWQTWVRFRESYGVPKWYTVMGSPDVPGLMCVRIFPYPDTDATLDFVYNRKPRAVQTFDLSTGAASVNLGVSAITINLSAAVLGPQHVGAVIRLAADSSGPPDGLDGLSPYYFEGNILSVPTAQSCTVDAAVPASLTSVSYRVSDPIDVEGESMTPAFIRCCEKHVALQRLMKNSGAVSAAYAAALVLAKEADARIQARRSAGVGGPYRAQLRFMPRGPDIS